MPHLRLAALLLVVGALSVRLLLGATAPHVSVVWESYPDTRYATMRLERLTQGARTWSPVTTVPRTASSAQDTQVTTGQTYRYRVVATGGMPLPDSPPSNEIEVVCCAAPAQM